ncbi:Molybdopterin-synthase adenylyltransferase [bioreactor metagenome]|jgi:sulfur carrier protein ThiS adenylyltransferase|uniref:Molybdopterin-synthase adenylyltransferase n=1 Tax=bioreactor metagenome TaxID=1076179 RepID=A0A645APG4_9ZZZZ
MQNFKKIKENLKTKIVGIAGAGGLGSNCAASLARTGVGKLIIADFDVVSEANLNRQFYFYDQIGMPKVEALKENIDRINSGTILQIHKTKVDESNIALLFASCDVVVEAFDDAFQKKLLIEFMLANMPDKPLVIGSGMAGWGNSGAIKVERYNNLYVCGDTSSEVSEGNPPLAPRVQIVSNMQANAVLEILLNND